jgi:PIF1-like helicase
MPESAHSMFKELAEWERLFSSYRALHADACAKGMTVLCVASSGIAAVLLPDGRTAHS